MTRYSAAADNLQGCSYISVGNAGGVMCCEDDSTTPTPAPTKAPTIGSCDFEKGFCGWIVDRTAPATFFRYRGETPSRNTGPRYDHTKEDSTGMDPTYRTLYLVGIISSGVILTYSSCYSLQLYISLLIKCEASLWHDGIYSFPNESRAPVTWSSKPDMYALRTYVYQ